MFSIAYRMTGSVADAEDIVQEAFLRLASGAEAESPKAFVATVTTRLAPDVVLYGDSGGQGEATFITPVFGRDRVAELIAAQFTRTSELGASLRAAWVNGQPGLVAYDDGGLIAVIALDVLDGQVQAIRAVANPEKLRHLGPVSRTWHLRSSDTGAESGTGVDDGDARRHRGGHGG
jgi:hypothetical protein